MLWESESLRLSYHLNISEILGLVCNGTVNILIPDDKKGYDQLFQYLTESSEVKLTRALPNGLSHVFLYNRDISGTQVIFCHQENHIIKKTE